MGHRNPHEDSPLAARGRGILASAAALLIVVGCVPPEPTPPPTQIEITTELVVCGGVIPPPGEPWCRPAQPSSRDVEVLFGRTVISTATTDPAGKLVLGVDPGTYKVRALDPAVYLDCTDALVTAVTNQTTPVTQTCVLNAP